MYLLNVKNILDYFYNAWAMKPLQYTRAQALPDILGRAGSVVPEVTQSRATSVTGKDGKTLLGHKNGSITSHYSASNFQQLIETANKVSTTLADQRLPFWEVKRMAPPQKSLRMKKPNWLEFG